MGILESQENFYLKRTAKINNFQNKIIKKKKKKKKKKRHSRSL